MERNPRRDEILALRAEGVGPREIGRRLGVTSGVVAGILFRSGKTSDGTRYDDDYKRFIVGKCRGKPTTVAWMMGHSPMTLWRWRRDLGE